MTGLHTLSPISITCDWGRVDLTHGPGQGQCTAVTACATQTCSVSGVHLVVTDKGSEKGRDRKLLNPKNVSSSTSSKQEVTAGVPSHDLWYKKAFGG